MDDNIWEAGSDHDPARWAGEPVEGDALPPVGDLVNQTIEVMKENIAPSAMASVGMFALIFLMVIGLLVGIMVPLLPGILLEDEGLVSIGAILSALLYIAGIFGTVAIGSLSQASLARAAYETIELGRPMGLSSAWNTITTDALSVLGAAVLWYFLILVGMLFCYVPGLILAFLMSHVVTVVAIRRLPAVEGVQAVIGHVMANPSWHIGVHVVGMLVALVIGMIPLVGLFFQYAWVAFYNVLVVRAAYPST